MQYRVVDLFFERLVLSAGTVIQELGVTHRAAIMSLRALKRLKLATEPFKRERYRVFWAREIDEALEGDAR